ncbi:MAG: regulatory signaling modulator protein AmpE [Halothiobacillaceae bacterium]
MLLLATLIALFAERLAPQLAERRSLVWFDRYAGALSGRLNVPGWLALTVLVAPWALLAVALQSLLHGVLWGLLELAFSVLVLFLALRPGSVDPAVDGYVAAREKGEDGTARHHAEHLLGGSVPQAVEDEVRAVADTLLLEANERWVAPLLWFVLLGPLGAVVYRLTAHVEQQSEQGGLREAARLLRAALDWLPARLLAGMYILSGSFEEGLNAWRQEGQVSVDTQREAPASRALELEQANRDLLLRVGRAALRTEEYSVTTEISETGDIEADANIVRSARGLVLRSLIAIVAIIALLALGDWIA